MGNVISLPVQSRTVSLRDAYIDALREGYNATDRFNKATASTMVGYLTAATVAFRITGDEQAAEYCEKAAKELMTDWTSYTHWVPWVHDKLSA